MSFKKIDSMEVNQFISSSSKEEIAENEEILSRHFSKISSCSEDQIRSIIQSDKLIQVLLSIIQNSGVPKISYQIRCKLFDFIAWDCLHHFQTIFNHICLCYDEEKNIHTVNLGDPDRYVLDIFDNLIRTGKLSSELSSFFKWNHKYETEELMLSEEHQFYELKGSEDNPLSGEEMEAKVFHSPVIRKLVLEVHRFGTATLPLPGWTLAEIQENQCFGELTQWFHKVFFHGVIVNSQWVTLNLIVVDFSGRCRQYFAAEIFKYGVQ